MLRWNNAVCALQIFVSPCWGKGGCLSDLGPKVPEKREDNAGAAGYIGSK